MPPEIAGLMAAQGGVVAMLIFDLVALAFVPSAKLPDKAFWDRMTWHQRTFTLPRMFLLGAVTAVVVLSYLL